MAIKKSELSGRDQILKALEEHKITLAMAKILLDNDPIEEEHEVTVPFQERVAHVTVIVDDGIETVIYDIQKMAEVCFAIEMEEPAYYDFTSARKQKVRKIEFSGKPLENVDGSQWTEIRRAK